MGAIQGAHLSYINLEADLVSGWVSGLGERGNGLFSISLLGNCRSSLCAPNESSEVGFASDRVTPFSIAIMRNISGSKIITRQWC